MNIFLVSTPHQFQQVNAAINAKNIKLSDMIVLYFDFHLNEDVSCYLNCKADILYIKNWTSKGIFKNYLNIQRYIFLLKKIRIKNSQLNLYSGQYFVDSTLLAFSILHPHSFYLMDEGTASFNVVSVRKNSKRFSFSLFLKSLVYMTFVRFPEKVIFYSQYDLQTSGLDVVEKYAFTKKDIKLSINPNYVIILGSSLASVNVISREGYLNILKQLKLILTDKNIDYYPHRKEDDNLLSKVSSLGFTVKKSNIPFEAIFAQLSLYPELIYSFVSPVLDNISKQYSSTPKLIIIEPLSKYYLNQDSVALYERIYEEYRRNDNVDIINL